MDRRPIGVFDSGLGGLTAVKELRRLLPHEDIVYFGDTGRVPYGTRSDGTIVRYARSDMDFLLRFDPKRVLIACGTVSTVALKVLRREYDLPLEGVVEAAAAAAAARTRRGVVGVMGTAATIRSGEYERLIRAAAPSVKIVSVACPLLVPLVENGRTDPEDLVVSTVVGEYLAEIRAAGADTVVMGCTHYPLLERAIDAGMDGGAVLISPGREAAERIARALERDGAGNAPDHAGTSAYYVSDAAEGFAAAAERFLCEPVSGVVEKVDVE